MELREGGLLLREPRASDADAIALACSDAEIARFIPCVPSPYTRRDAETFLQRIRDDARRSSERTFAIVDARSDELLGLVSVSLEEGGNVGYWVKREARERGVATRALNRVVAWAREQGVSHLRLMTHPANIPSQRAAEKAGFVRVGLGAHDPPFRDGTNEGVLFEVRLG